MNKRDGGLSIERNGHAHGINMRWGRGIFNDKNQVVVPDCLCSAWRAEFCVSGVVTRLIWGEFGKGGLPTLKKRGVICLY